MRSYGDLQRHAVFLSYSLISIPQMSYFNIHWKQCIVPSGVVLVSLWALYLGAIALFQPLAPPSTDQAKARPSRVRPDMNRCTTRVSRAQRSSTDTRRGQRVSASSQVKVKPSRGLEKKMASKNQWRKVARSLSDALPPEQKLSTNAPEPNWVSAGKTTNHLADSRLILRESIMAEAFSIAMKSEKPWMNLISVAKVQYSRGDKDAARDVLLMAEKMAADPDDQVKASTAVREVVKAMLSQRLNDEAISALQNIQKSSERERAISEIAAWSARQGRVNIAKNLLVQITNPSSRDVALVAIAESEATYEGASVAMQTVGSIVSAKRKDDAYRRIALKLAVLNNFIQADQAVQLVRNDKVKNATLASLARQRVRSGDSPGGLNTLQYVNDPSMADSALRELSGDLARLGQFDTSAYVTTRIRGEAQKSYALELLSVEQAKSGDLSGSLVRTSAITMKSVRERALRSVSSVTADNGEPGRARNVAIRISSHKERNRAYRAIAQASAADGDHVSAYNTLQEIDRPDEKALALVSIARTRQKQGDNRQALSMLEDARRTAHDVTSVVSLDRIQSDMAVAYAERRESSLSLNLAEKIKSSRRRDATYGNLARTLIGKHDVFAAQQSMLAISSEKLRLKAEDDIARTMARQVTPRNALKRVRVLQSSRQRITFLLEVARKT